MKRIISLLLVCSVLIGFAACKKSGVIPILRGISFTADITYYNENYKGDCSIDEGGTLRLTLSEPESLSGYTVTLSDEGITAEYLGITFTPSAGNLPFSSVSDGIYKALCSVVEPESADKSGDTYIIKGGEGAQGFTLYLSPTGLPQSLLIPDERFSVYFYNVAYI